MFARFFKPRPRPVVPAFLKDRTYIYVNGVVYMRHGQGIAYCDFTGRQEWEAMKEADFDPEFVSNIAHALLLAEGLIRITQRPIPFGNSLN